MSLTPCILDEDPGQLEGLAAVIGEMGYEPIPTTDPEEALRLVKHGRCRLLLADFHMPGMRRYEFLDQVLRCDPGVHVIVMTREYTLETALEAIRRGAADFLPKPVDRARLKKTLDEVAALYDQRRRVKALEEQLLKDLEFHGIVGKSPVMLEVFDATARRWWIRCWRVSFLDICAEPLRGRQTRGRACSNMQTGEPFFWMK